MAGMEKQLRDQLGAAVEHVVREVERGIVTRWVAIVETVGPDGERGLWLEGNRDLAPWELLGLLAFADTLVRSDEYDGDDDD